jgi:hypothetical protein
MHRAGFKKWGKWIRFIDVVWGKCTILIQISDCFFMHDDRDAHVFNFRDEPDRIFPSQEHFERFMESYFHKSADACARNTSDLSRCLQEQNYDRPVT